MSIKNKKTINKENNLHYSIFWSEIEITCFILNCLQNIVVIILTILTNGIYLNFVLFYVPCPVVCMYVLCLWWPGTKCHPNKSLTAQALWNPHPRPLCGKESRYKDKRNSEN